MNSPGSWFVAVITKIENTSSLKWRWAAAGASSISAFKHRLTFSECPSCAVIDLESMFFSLPALTCFSNIFWITFDGWCLRLPFLLPSTNPILKWWSFNCWWWFSLNFASASCSRLMYWTACSRFVLSSSNNSLVNSRRSCDFRAKFGERWVSRSPSFSKSVDIQSVVFSGRGERLAFKTTR